MRWMLLIRPGLMRHGKAGAVADEQSVTSPIACSSPDAGGRPVPLQSGGAPLDYCSCYSPASEVELHLKSMGDDVVCQRRTDARTTATDEMPAAARRPPHARVLRAACSPRARRGRPLPRAAPASTCTSAARRRLAPPPQRILDLIGLRWRCSCERSGCDAPCRGSVPCCPLRPQGALRALRHKHAALSIPAHRCASAPHTEPNVLVLAAAPRAHRAHRVLAAARPG